VAVDATVISEVAMLSFPALESPDRTVITEALTV
jgi:hypothetical protein